MPDGLDQMTDDVRDALDKAASGAHVAFATVRKGAGAGGGDRVVGAKAIERIGGQLDGLMRADRPGADDTVRTSARFSIVATEWPGVRARLVAALARGARREG